MNRTSDNAPFTIDMPAEATGVARQRGDVRWLNRPILFGLFAALCVPVLTFGATEVWAQALQATFAVVMLLLCGIRSYLSADFELPASPVLLPGVLFVGYVALQYITMSSVFGSARLITIGTCAVMALAVVNVVRARRNQKTLFISLATFGFVLALVSVFLSTSDATSNLLLGFRKTNATSASVFGPYVNHNHYAGLMEMLAPLALAAAWLEKGGKRTLLFFAGLVMVASVVVSRSRGGVLAIAVGLIFACAIVFRSQRTQRSLIGFLLVCAVLVGLVFAFASDKTLDRFKDSTDMYRWSIYRDSVRMFVHKPVFGFGIGTFEQNYPKYQSFGSDLAVNHAHNDYLEFLVETGAIGFGLLAWFVACVFRSARLKFREKHDVEGRLLTLGALTGIVCLLVHGFLDFNLQIPANAAMFVALCSVVATPFRRRIRYVQAPVTGEHEEFGLGNDDEL